MPTECPSGRYLKAVRTIAGLTPEKPFTTFGPITVATEFDYAEWYALVPRLRASMEASFRALFAQAQAKDPKNGGSLIGAAGERVQSIRDRIAAQPEPWDFTELHDLNEAVDATVTLAVDTACEWQRLDEQLDELGIDVPEHRPGIGADPDPLGWIETLGLVAGSVAIAGGAIWLARKLSKRRSAAA